MGRKKDPIWNQVKKLNDKVFKCKYCGEEFAGGASRIKAHLSGIEGKGIRKCTGVLKDVQIEATSTLGDSNKTPCHSVNPCNPQQDFFNSSKGNDDVPEECILFPELLQMATVPTINDSNQRTMNDVNSDSIEVNYLNSNQSVMGNVNSGDPNENSISNHNITRNIDSGDLSKGKSINMGGKNDGFSQNVEPGLNGGVKYRMYDLVDISQTETMGVDTEKLDVDICSENPEDVQEEAYDASNKRLKKSIDSSHLEDNFVNLNSQSSSLKGNAQLYRMPTSEYFVGEVFQSYIDKIWGWLMNDEESVIGVCGMGGVGKTTLLKHIYNKLLDASHHVIWVSTIPRDNSIFQLQKIIAETFNWHISDKDDKIKVTARLFHTLNETSKCVIILDDVWDDICLEGVGIPLINSEVQVIIASRLLDVCQTMGSKKYILKMKPLLQCDTDNRDLFFKVLRKDEALLSPNVKDIAQSIIDKCDGLPLAIAIMARRMRGKEDIRELEYVLKNLRNLEQHDMKMSVFPLLALSYNHLNDKFLQECFLCCAFHLGYDVLKSQETLIVHFVDEELIDGKNSLETQFDEGHVILNNLMNNNLLVEEDDGYFSIHSLVWDMAANIAKESEGYMVKISGDLRAVSTEQEWKEDLRKVISSIKEIPSGTVSPRCPKLSTLGLGFSHSLKLIPNSFFVNMPSLKLLDLSYCYQIEHLPSSVSILESLTALLLRGCSSLKYVPSLAKLQKLERLDLSRTAITELPLGMEMLINLRWLSIEGTQELIISPASVIPIFTNLQVLLIDMYPESVKLKVDNLEGMKVLECICFRFSDGNEFNAYVRGRVSYKKRGLKNYYLGLLERRLNSAETYYDLTEKVYSTDKTIMFSCIGNATPLLLPVDMNKILIENCDEWRNSCDVLSFDDKNNSKSVKILSCTITSCAKLENVFCLSNNCSFCSSLQSVESLTLSRLKSLSMLTLPPWGPFYSLRDLDVHGCHRLKMLLTDVMAGVLQNLETLSVCDCETMEEIFSSEKNNESIDGDSNVAMTMFPRYQNFDELFSSGTGRNKQEEQETDAVHINHTHATKLELPKLKSVHLQCLPQLKIVYEGILVCDSLKKFRILHCLDLVKVPQIQPLFQELKIHTFPVP